MKTNQQFLKRRESINAEADMLYSKLRSLMPGLCRMAVAFYEKESGLLHSFFRSPSDSPLLNHYSIALSEVPSLSLLAETGEVRVIDDIESINSNSFHTQELIEHGIKSSYTMPMYLGKDLLGFVFFDSDQEQFFDASITGVLDVYTRLIEAMIAMDVLPVRALMGMVSSSTRMTGMKDRDTGEHIARVAYYVEIIATELSKSEMIDDEIIEYMWLYAPLHDIGKIGVPDKVLLKPSRLTCEEMEAMKEHVSKGIELMNQILSDFSFEAMHHTRILKNLIATHHERWDGLGYPKGLKGGQIPLEGRVMAVADVFDAMSSARVYRDAYALEETFEYIASHSGKRFDPKCVDAFLANKDKVMDMFRSFNARGF